MKSKNNGKDFCMFALPGMFCFFAVVIIPFVYGVYLTLTDWNGVSKVKNFIGLKNFAGVMRDGQFWTSLLLTFKYVIFVVFIYNRVDMFLPLLAARPMRRLSGIFPLHGAVHKKSRKITSYSFLLRSIMHCSYFSRNAQTISAFPISL